MSNEVSKGVSLARGEQGSRLLKLAVLAAVLTIALKALAWWLTGSVGLLSDAMESFVNLATASFALWTVAVACAPADREHPFGHGKAEYFSSGLAGVFILCTAVAIGVAALERLWHPQPLATVGLGLLLSLASALVNGLMARALRREGERAQSMALIGEAKHLMADVRTTFGVIVGVAAVSQTGWLWLDPLIALAVAGHILIDAVQLLRGAAQGLMDEALPELEQQAIRDAFERGDPAVRVTVLRTRRAGRESFAQVVLRVPAHWTVQEAHAQVESVENALQQQFPQINLLTHFEPDDDGEYRRH